MIKVAIIGASGYTGAELIRLLAPREDVKIVLATSKTYAGRTASGLYPNLTGPGDVEFSVYRGPEDAASADLAFVALPHGQSMETVAGLVTRGLKVIDLSGDFRLPDEAVYTAWYGVPHTQTELLKSAVYGLPEINKAAIAGASLVSNPGCYPTSAILALAPAIASHMIYSQDIIIDSISGVSGAGRTATETTHFCVRADNLTAYKVGGLHQHIPEIELYLAILGDDEVKISFTPHLGPYSRGIYTTIYADLANDLTPEEAHNLYADYYTGSIFVKIVAPGEMPELKAVLGSNGCHIGVTVDERTGRLIVVSALDNLVKGASGQAVQNMNIMFGLPEDTGLKELGVYP